LLLERAQDASSSAAISAALVAVAWHDRTVIYRMRTYQAIPDRLAAFNAFFIDYLLPVQIRHGARLVGRWATTDDRVVAVWQYDDMAHYQQVQAAVRDDPDSTSAQRHRVDLGELFTSRTEAFMTSTLPE
jgi:hypothetical protein